MLGRFVVAAEMEARRRGWATVVANVDAFGSDVGRYVEVLSERRVDGILMAAPQAEGDPTLGARLRGRFPVVSLHTIQGLRVPLIGSDHVETGLLAVRHLILHGHRAIGMVSGTPGRYVTAARMIGYAQAFTEARLEPGDSELVEEGDSDDRRRLPRDDATSGPLTPDYGTVRAQRLHGDRCDPGPV